MKKGWLDSEERITCLGVGSVICTLFIPEVKKVHRILAKLWNRLLMILFIPLFVSGLFVAFDGTWNYVEHKWGFGVGYVIGLIAGMVFHELSHACACLSYGGQVFEGGVMMRYFLPGAYVYIEYDNVKNRFKRIQILASGVECNIAVAGVFLLLLRAEVFDSDALIFAALNNILFVLFNLSLVKGLDGMGIYSELLGVDNLVEKANLLIRDGSAKRRLRKRGINGMATIVCCYIVVIFQILLPLILILNTVGLLWILII